MAGWRSGPVAVVAAGMLASLSLSAQEPRTVWSGAFTHEQAVRGRELYKTACGHCHRDDLTGGGSEEGAPPLIGPIFTVRWRNEPLSEMFLTIGTTMPKNKPDSLTPQVVADIISFLLEMNEVPAGSSPLPADLDTLKQILVTEK